MRKVTLHNKNGDTIEVFPIDAKAWRDAGYVAKGEDFPAEDDVFADMTVAQLHGVIESEGLNIHGYKSMNKSDLMSSIVEARREQDA